jgi:hypothetical protein
MIFVFSALSVQAEGGTATVSGLDGNSAEAAYQRYLDSLEPKQGSGSSFQVQTKTGKEKPRTGKARWQLIKPERLIHRFDLPITGAKPA